MLNYFCSDGHLEFPIDIKDKLCREQTTESLTSNNLVDSMKMILKTFFQYAALINYVLQWWPSWCSESALHFFSVISHFANYCKFILFKQTYFRIQSNYKGH